MTFVEFALPKPGQWPLIGLEIMCVIGVRSESYPRMIEIIIILSVIFNWILILGATIFSDSPLSKTYDIYNYSV